VYGYEFEGDRYDVGEKLGFIQTTLEIALSRKDLHEPIIKLIKQINEKYNDVEY
jgi:UTP--glucose-1-phosphate uridylyltransferase